MDTAKNLQHFNIVSHEQKDIHNENIYTFNFLLLCTTGKATQFFCASVFPICKVLRMISAPLFLPEIDTIQRVKKKVW